jgi:TolA-binding protein
MASYNEYQCFFKRCIEFKIGAEEMKNISTLRFFAGLFATLLISSGCSYDNSLYNARQNFNQAQARPLNQQGKPTSQAVDEYTKTIKKCGYILTERPKSKEADDALFLLAKALFYKGNSQFQAKDQFLSLIQNFPDSPYASEAVLYLAQVDRQVNESIEAEKLLSAFLLDPKQSAYYPKAILLLADFAVQDNDNTKAQYWLEKLLNQYPKSLQAKEALFILGQLFFEQKDYTKSLEQFRKVVATREISRNIKLDARSYIALNLLYLKELERGYGTIKKLLRDENRPEKIPSEKIISSRILMAMNNDDEAVEMLQAIIKSNPRTLSSAEAYYWLGEYHYYKKGDVESAIENYNKAKTESTLSPYQTQASAKHTALVQVKQTANFQAVDDPRQYIDARIESSEHYFMTLSMPDSAYAIFDEIARIPEEIQIQIDSLMIEQQNILMTLDSLGVLNDSTSTSLSDSLSEIKQSEAIIGFSDSVNTSVQVTESIRDTLSGNINIEKPMVPDSLVVTPDNKITTPQKTSENNKTPDELRDLAKARPLQTKLSDLTKLVSEKQDIKQSFISEYIPFSLFVLASLITKTNPDTLLLSQLYADMLEQYPNNQYTIAMKTLVEGKPVQLIDTRLEAEEAELDYAITIIEAEPDSSIAVLNKLSESTYKNIKEKALFRLGWHYTFEQRDTTLAKVYFDKILKDDKNTDVARTILRFYSGNKYTISFNPNLLTDNILEETDSLKVSAISDSLLNTSESDSLKTKEGIDKPEQGEPEAKESLDNPVKSDTINTPKDVDKPKGIDLGGQN